MLVLEQTKVQTGTRQSQVKQKQLHCCVGLASAVLVVEGRSSRRPEVLEEYLKIQKSLY